MREVIIEYLQIVSKAPEDWPQLPLHPLLRPLLHHPPLLPTPPLPRQAIAARPPLPDASLTVHRQLMQSSPGWPSLLLRSTGSSLVVEQL